MNGRNARALLFALLCPFFFCAACSFRQKDFLPESDAGAASDNTAVRIWQRYTARDAAAEKISGPFRISANLRYTNASGENTRVSSLLWSNGKVDSPHPLRLDILAGIGAVAAKIREDDDSFIAFSPDEKIAYTRARDNRALLSFGVPIPLSLGDLTLLLTGRGGRLFLPAGIRTDSGVPPEHDLTDGGARYTIVGAPLSGMLELSDTGVPIAWREQKQSGWSLAIEPDDINPLLPRKLSISHPKGYSALIVVKDISRVSPPYTDAQLEITLPPGTETKSLQ
ncbi:MAG: hypothetical protein LBD42_08605 [Desulfovibrio sp.]|jgi:hypothetical protein|nr:hypothetical protein [Desulfovibrio sp.]